MIRAEVLKAKTASDVADAIDVAATTGDHAL